MQIFHASSESPQISCADRSFQYGDGIFTTALVVAGKVVYLQDHLTRLQTAAAKLGIEGIDLEALAAAMVEVATSQNFGGIKVLVSRGEGGRGYDPSGCRDTIAVISCFELPTHYERWQQEGISLAIAKTPLAVNPFLAGLKTTSRLEQVVAKQELKTLGSDDAVFSNAAGNMVETNVANLFWRVGSQCFTPDLTQSGVTGIMRARVMEHLEQMDISCQVVAEPVNVLEKSDEIWVTNSLMQVVPVRLFNGKRMSDFVVSRRLQGVIGEALS
ncbi:aminodeoxychorismate lyase [Corallincola platygyrae]|uniref:Aminodeoxychorismate lyase n=1 Tax=Corallincola platygyrae TaxID=1193278 RepID=A0ABW4XHG2_9GAMM